MSTVVFERGRGGEERREEERKGEDDVREANLNMCGMLSHAPQISASA